MPKKTISLIAALTKDRAIGRGNDLVVRIADDLKRFRELTTGHAVIMGRKTYESIGRPLPNRANYVISRDMSLKIPGAIVCRTLEEGFDLAGREPGGEVFVIGGGEVYKQALPKADKLYLTVVDSDESGDVFFPDYSAFTKIVRREDRVDEKTGLKYSWIDLER
jgi:dihydrofolate reductase